MHDGAVQALVRHGTTRPLVVAALLLRACVNGAFMTWLLAVSPGWVDVFHGGALYAIADGAVGLMLVLLIGLRSPIGAPVTLVAVTSVDALMRLAAGAALLMLPGIPQVPITIVLFYGIIGVWAASAGTIAIVASVIAHAHRHTGTSSHSASHAMFDPLSVEGVIALMLALYALAVGPPSTAEELRVAGGVASGSFALLLLVAARGVLRNAAGDPQRTADIPTAGPRPALPHACAASNASAAMGSPRSSRIPS